MLNFSAPLFTFCFDFSGCILLGKIKCCWIQAILFFTFHKSQSNAGLGLSFFYSNMIVKIIKIIYTESIFQEKKSNAIIFMIKLYTFMYNNYQNFKNLTVRTRIYIYLETEGAIYNCTSGIAIISTSIFELQSEEHLWHDASVMCDHKQCKQKHGSHIRSLPI